MEEADDSNYKPSLDARLFLTEISGLYTQPPEEDKKKKKKKKKKKGGRKQLTLKQAVKNMTINKSLRKENKSQVFSPRLIGIRCSNLINAKEVSTIAANQNIMTKAAFWQGAK